MISARLEAITIPIHTFHVHAVVDLVIRSVREMLLRVKTLPTSAVLASPHNANLHGPLAPDTHILLYFTYNALLALLTRKPRPSLEAYCGSTVRPKRQRSSCFTSTSLGDKPIETGDG